MPSSGSVSAVGLVVSVAIGDEIEVGGHDPRSAESDFDAGDEIQLVVEDSPFVELTVSDIFENHNAIARAVGPLDGWLLACDRPQIINTRQMGCLTSGSAAKRDRETPATIVCASAGEAAWFQHRPSRFLP